MNFEKNIPNIHYNWESKSSLNNSVSQHKNDNKILNESKKIDLNLSAFSILVSFLKKHLFLNIYLKISLYKNYLLTTPYYLQTHFHLKMLKNRIVAQSLLSFLLGFLPNILFVLTNI